MPTYMFKCPVCEKTTEILMSLSEFNEPNNTIMGTCSNKECNTTLHRENQIINFAGDINMSGASDMATNQKKYSNKAGGPVGLSKGKPIGKIKIS